MAVSDRCPSQAELSDLMLGRLAEAEAAPLEEHLLACSQCLQATQALQASDTLVSAVRESPRFGEELAAVQGLARHVRQRLASGSNSSAEMSVEETVLPDSRNASSWDDESEISSFFKPPASGDELGRLGQFRVLKPLGKGGMGVVFEAEDTQLHRRVALKVVLPEIQERQTGTERFLREARAAAAVRHDHIVTIYQVGQDGAVPYLAMELLEGETLDDRLKRVGQIPVNDALRIGREIAEGLAAAHERGLLHRDIKPANVWLEAGRDRVKILDFGLARAMADDVRMTRHGAILGTPSYMAPEQAAGQDVDPRADLFSLGCILYRACTGQMPFPGPTLIAILQSLATHNPKPPREVVPAIPAEVSNFIMRLLAKQPESRPFSAAVAVEELRRLEQSTSTAAAPPRGRRPRWQLAAAGAAALLLLAGVVVIIRDRLGNEQARLTVPEGGSVTVAPTDPPTPQPQETKPPPASATSPSKPNPPIASPAAPVPDAGQTQPPIGAAPPTAPPRRPEGPPSDSTVTSRPSPQNVVPPAATVPASWPTVGSWLPGSSLDVLPGLVARPAKLPGIARWQVDTRRLRSALTDQSQISWSADGKFVALGQGPQVRIYQWNDNALHLSSTFAAHGTQEPQFSWGPDGRQLLVNSRDTRLGTCAIQMWRPGDAGVRLVKPAESKTYPAVFSPDGRWIARSRIVNVGEDRGQIQVLDPATSELVTQHVTSERFVSRLSWHPNGQKLAAAVEYALSDTSGKTGRGIRVWDVATWKVEHQLNELAGQVDQLQWNAEGSELLIGMNYAKSWLAWRPGEPRPRLAQTGTMVRLSPDGQWIASRLDDASIQLVHSADGTPGELLTLGREKVRTGFDWLPGGKQLVTLPRDAWPVGVNVYDLATKQSRALLEQPPAVRGTAWSRDGQWIATWGTDHCVRLWRAADGRLEKTLADTFKTQPLAVAWSADGRLLVTGNSDGRTLLWDVAQGKAPAEFSVHKGPVRSVAFSEDGQWIASAGDDRAIRLWNSRTRQFAKSLDGHAGAVNNLAWHPTEPQRLASIGSDRAIRIWDVATGKQALEIKDAGQYAVAWSPDGRQLVGRQVWQADGTPLQTLTDGADPDPAYVEFSRQRNRLLACYPVKSFAWNLRARIYDTTTWTAEPEFVLSGQFGDERRRPAAWSPDGLLLVAGTGNCRFEIRDPLTGEVRWTGAHLPEGRGASFTAAGETLTLDPADESELFYSVETAAGETQVLTPAEFRTRTAAALELTRASTPKSPGPEESAASRWLPGPIQGALPGLAPRPASLRGIERWQVDTLQPRSAGKQLWSPDGKYLAYMPVATPGQVRLYEFIRGRLELRQLLSGSPLSDYVGHSIAGFSWSPDSRQFVAASGGPRVPIWHVDDSAIRVEAFLPTSVHGWVAWSPDGKWIVTSPTNQNGDFDLVVWNAQTRELAGKLPADKTRWNRFVWSPDGRRLAAYDKNRVRVWDAESRQTLRTTDLEFSVESLSWAPQQPELMIAASEHEKQAQTKIVIWNVATDATRLELPYPPVRPGTLSPDGRWLLVRPRNGEARLASAANGSLSDSGPYQYSCFWHPHSRLITISADNADPALVRTYDLEIKETLTLLVQPPRVRGVGWSPNGQTIATFGSDHLIRLWRAADGRPGAILRGHAALVNAVAWSPDDQSLASVSSDGRGLLWDANGAREVCTFAIHAGPINAVAFSGDGHYLATGGSDQTVRIWDCRTRQFVRALSGAEGAVHSLAWAPDSRQLLAYTSDGKVHVWDAATGMAALKLDESLPATYAFGAATWSPDGKFLIGGKVWNADGTPADTQLPGLEVVPRQLVWSRDGSRLMAAWRGSSAPESVVRIYNLSSWTARPDFRLPDQYLPPSAGCQAPVDFSPDGNLIVASTGYSTFEVRDPITGDVRWRAVILSDGRSATVSAAGELKMSDPSVADELMYYTQQADGTTNTLTPAEFGKRYAQ